MPEITVTALTAANRDWAHALLIERWGSTAMIARDQTANSPDRHA